MVDNFGIVYPLLDTSDKDDFYHVQIIRRGKDHPNLPSANRTIISYYVSSLSPLSKYEYEIKTMCEIFKARAYINLARRSFKDVTIKTVKSLVTRISDGDYKKPYKAWNTVCGALKSKKDTCWVIDMDGYVIGCPEASEIENFVNSLTPIGDKIKYRIPTKTGHHLITSGFHLQNFHTAYPDIEVHKNNPTILYIPKSLD